MSKNKKIRQIAAQLPSLPKLDKQGNILYTKHFEIISGAELIKQKITTINEKGIDVPIIPKGRYKRQIQGNPILRNHVEDMIEIYRNDGAVGVNEYIKLCFSFNKLSNPGIEF